MKSKTKKTNPPVKRKHSVLVISLLSCLLLSTVIYFYFKPGVPIASVDNKSLQPVSKYNHPEIPVVTQKNNPSLLAQSYILLDNYTNTILLSKNSKTRIYPASITKLATALTALNIYPLDDVVSVGSTYSEGKIMELRSGENITVRSLVTALLVYSANDSAYNLAIHHQNGISGFVKEMNLLIEKYHLTDTNFTNYDGIHSPSHYSTVYDLAQLGRLAIKNPVIRETVKTKKLTVSDISGQISHHLESTNELLDVVPEIQGLKTGWTPEAGGCFVSLINIDGHELIGVVAQSDERFVDTQKLVTWAKENIVWSSYQQNAP